MSDKKNCCEMHKKVALGIAKVYSEAECGISDSALVDFHDFGYQSDSGVPVGVALSIKYCPWCGTERDHDDETRRNVEVIRPRHNG